MNRNSQNIYGILMTEDIKKVRLKDIELVGVFLCTGEWMVYWRKRNSISMYKCSDICSIHSLFNCLCIWPFNCYE